MSGEKVYLTVTPSCITTDNDSDQTTLCVLNSTTNISVDTISTDMTNDQSDVSGGITGTLTSSPSSVGLENKTDLSSGVKIDSISELSGSGNADMTVLLNRSIQTHVASDVNLGSLGDLSDSLPVSESGLDPQMKDDGNYVKLY